MPNRPRKGGWKEEGGGRKVVSTAPGASQAVRGGPDSPCCIQRRSGRMRSGRMSSHGGPAPTHAFPGAPWGSEASFRSCGHAASAITFHQHLGMEMLRHPHENRRQEKGRSCPVTTGKLLKQHHLPPQLGIQPQPLSPKTQSKTLGGPSCPS